MVVDKVRGVLENSNNLNKKIEANHALAGLSDVEKTMNSVPLQGFDISQYNPHWGSWVQETDGRTGAF